MTEFSLEGDNAGAYIHINELSETALGIPGISIVVEQDGSEAEILLGTANAEKLIEAIAARAGLSVRIGWKAE